MSRRSRANALAVHKAAGTYVPRLKTRECFYTGAEIRSNRHEELAAAKRQLAAQRDRMVDREWALRPDAAKLEGTIELMTGLDIPAPPVPVEVLPDWLAVPSGFQAASAIEAFLRAIDPVVAAVDGVQRAVRTLGLFHAD